MTAFLAWADAHPILGGIVMIAAVLWAEGILFAPFSIMSLSNRVEELEKEARKR